MTILKCENGHELKTRREITGMIRRYCKQCMKTVNFIPQQQQGDSGITEISGVDVENVKTEIKDIQEKQEDKKEIQQTLQQPQQQQNIVITEETIKFLIKLPCEIAANLYKDESVKLNDADIKEYIPIAKRVFEKRAPDVLKSYSDEIVLVIGLGMIYYLKLYPLMQKSREKKKEKEINVNEPSKILNWNETIQNAEVIK